MVIKSRADLLHQIERLQSFIDLLQKALGWQVEIEKISWDRKDYEVHLVFKLTYKGKVWPDILRASDYQRVVFEMAHNKLYELWERELKQNPQGINGPAPKKAPGA